MRRHPEIVCTARATLPGRGRRAVRVLALALGASMLAGCGGGARTASSTAASGSPSAADPHAAEPFTAQEKRVARGAQLVVSEGCAACHLIAGAKAAAPAFITFAGHHVTLADGRRVLVDERFLRDGLLHPQAAELKGYDPAPMIAALAHLHLATHPEQATALAAFIEEIGPEPG
jgi:cytochrome c5